MRITKQRGSALLAVLWLSAALAAMAFSLSSVVREETERASTSVDGLRCYYLAASAIDRAALELLWSVQNPQKPILPPTIKTIDYHFDVGDARVTVMPEAAKLDVNSAPLEMLYHLCLALDIEPGRAAEIAAGIDGWRRGIAGPAAATRLFPGAGPSFPGPPASFHEIEELLLVKGITPDIFYGTYVPAPEGTDGSSPRLVPRQGLEDCLSVFGSNGTALDANATAPAVLIAIGMPPQAVAALVQQRRLKPFTEQTLLDFMQMIGAGGFPLKVIGKSIITLRATARLRLPNGQPSDLKRTVAEQVKYMPPGYDSQIHVLRWYDSAARTETAWSN